MHEVRIDKVGKRYIPSGWHEMPPGGSLYFAVDTLITEQDFTTARLKILKRLLKIPKSVLLNIDACCVQEMIQLLKWMDIRKNTKVIFREFTIDKKSYYLPADDFDQGTALQFALGADYYKIYIEKQEDKDLHYLCSTLLYTDVPLCDKAEIEKRADMFAQLRPVEKMTILAYFAAIQEMIAEKFGQWLFRDDEGSAPASINFGWWGVYMDIAESGVFGDLRGVYQSRFYDIVVYLIQKKEQYEAMKKEMKKQSK
jgi:hypothetical protein